jgi:cysteinyl-tRNA synthetase
MKHLGGDLDIHCGGIDNAFPHHTNEIAQSEAFLGHKWCNYWFHVLHLNTNSGKMSKSTGEFLTVSLLESKGYDPMVYRLFCLQSHYRKNLVFTYENLDNAKVTYQKLVGKIATLKEGGDVDEAAFAELKKGFTDALDNDLNTSLAITAVYNVLKAKCSDATKLALLADFDRVLSLNLLEAAAAIRAAAEAEAKAAANEHADDPEAEEIEALIAARAAAKKEKNFAEADRIRAELTSRGITLTDTAQGTKWHRN